MSRQNFVSSDFFVGITEKEARKALLLLPQHLPHITLLKEDTLVHSTRFLFEDMEKAGQFYIDVSMMSLNDQYTRYNLHVSYTNGHAFNHDVEIGNVLYQFEQAIHASVKNNFECLYLVDRRKPTTRKNFSFFNSLLSLLISKYHY